MDLESTLLTTVNDDNVLFYWSLAGQHEYDKASKCCLLKLVQKWVTKLL